MPGYSINKKKTAQEEKNLRRSQFSKKRGGGGVWQGMIMITETMVFSFDPFPYRLIGN